VWAFAPGRGIANPVKVGGHRTSDVYFDRPAVRARAAYPGSVSPEKVNELVAVLTPMGASITGPPPFDPET